jgi:threonylcarbamoyladenosine tRNA methylthiotransferase MtaB
MDFGHIHIFAYSSRAGTKAAGMPNQLERDVKRTRSRQLHELASQSRRKVLERSVGNEFEVLIEGGGDHGSEGHRTWLGYMPNYLRVEVRDMGAADLENKIVRVRTLGLSEGGERLLAELI